MPNIGPIISQKNAPAIGKQIEYLEDEKHPDHKGYKLTPIKSFGDTTPQSFARQCEEMLAWYNEEHPLVLGLQPKVMAEWLMPRFADGVRLSPEESTVIEDNIKTVFSPHAIGLYNWHIPPVPTHGRAKGPDINFIVASICNVGGVPVRLRHEDHSLWGLLRETLNYTIIALNVERRKKNLPLIPSVEDVRRQKHIESGALYLCEQLSCLPQIPKDSREVKQALGNLGYNATPTGFKDVVRVLRRIEPVFDHIGPASGGFTVSLNVLLQEILLTLVLRKKREEENAMAKAAADQALTAPTNHTPPTPSSPVMEDDEKPKRPGDDDGSYGM